MKIDRHLAVHTRRDAWVEVNLNTFENNVRTVKASLPEDVGLLAVIKADAYGHGAPMMMPILDSVGVDMVGVASVDEAAQIRATQTETPILVLGPSPDWALQYASEENFQVSIFTPQHLGILANCYAQTQHPTDVQIKIDTGMNRIGIPYSQAVAFVKQCLAEPGIRVKGVFTHLASVDDPDIYQAQLCRWQQVINTLNSPEEAIEDIIPWKHFASSNAMTKDLCAYGNLARPGIGLFGYGPLADRLALKPMMNVKARIVYIHTLEPNEGVSYNHRFINTTGQPRRIATLPLGYADGIPRGLSNQMEILYQGKRLPQVGTICMDQLMVDVTDAPEAETGDIVTLIGESRGHYGDDQIWLNAWAKHLNTIEYELMTGLRVRLPRTYVR
jgi:alanine racemase